MNSTLDWENTDWLEGARNLVEWVNQRHPNERLMIFLRHSQRDVIEDHSKQFSTGLTEIGKQMSFEMGTRLPSSKSIRIYFSFVSRCFETAEELAKGLRENGGDIVEFESEPLLVMPEYTDELVWENLQPDGKNVTEFVNRWADGEFGDRIQKFENYMEKLMNHTFNRLKDETNPVMHIHVSHDLALMAIKRAILERPIGYEDRESFQGGISASADKEGLWYIYNSGEEIHLSLKNLDFKI